RPDDRRLRVDGAGRRGGGGRARRERRGARRADAEAARRGGAPPVGGEDGARRDRPGGAAHLRLRGRARGDPRREGDPRPPRTGASRDRLRRAVSVLADRGRVRAVGRARPRRGPAAARVLSERIRLWLEPGTSEEGRGFWLRDAATEEPVSWRDERIHVVKVAGASYRAEALQHESFEPGRRLALVPEPENEH